MFGLGRSKKIISASQLKAGSLGATGKVGFLSDIKAKAGRGVLSRSNAKRDFVRHLGKVNKNGVTESGLKDALASMVTDRTDSLSGQEVDRIIRASGVSKSDISRRVAKMEHSQRIEHERTRMESLTANRQETAHGFESRHNFNAGMNNTGVHTPINSPTQTSSPKFNNTKVPAANEKQEHSGIRNFSRPEKKSYADNYEPHATTLDTRETFGEIKQYNLNYNKHADISSVQGMIAKIQNKQDNPLGETTKEKDGGDESEEGAEDAE